MDIGGMQGKKVSFILSFISILLTVLLLRTIKIKVSGDHSNEFY